MGSSGSVQLCETEDPMRRGHREISVGKCLSTEISCVNTQTIMSDLGRSVLT
jgi:hypothetical protein